LKTTLKNLTQKKSSSLDSSGRNKRMSTKLTHQESTMETIDHSRINSNLYDDISGIIRLMEDKGLLWSKSLGNIIQRIAEISCTRNKSDVWIFNLKVKMIVNITDYSSPDIMGIDYIACI